MFFSHSDEGESGFAQDSSYTLQWVLQVGFEPTTSFSQGGATVAPVASQLLFLFSPVLSPLLLSLLSSSPFYFSTPPLLPSHSLLLSFSLSSSLMRIGRFSALHLVICPTNRGRGRVARGNHNAGDDGAKLVTR